MPFFVCQLTAKTGLTIPDKEHSALWASNITTFHYIVVREVLAEAAATVLQIHSSHLKQINIGLLAVDEAWNDPAIFSGRLPDYAHKQHHRQPVRSSQSHII